MSSGGGDFSVEKSPPPGPLPKRRGGDDGGCEGGGFSERSPSLALPPEERLAFGAVVSSGLVPPESWVRFLAAWLRSRRLTEPPRPLRRGAASADAGGIPSVSLAADSSLCGGSQEKVSEKRRLVAVFFRAHTLHVRGGSVSRRGHNQAYRRPHPLSGETK